MDQDITAQLNAQSAKIDAIYVSVEKTRKYFLTIVWITILGVLLPLVGLMFVVPSFLGSYANIESAQY